MGFITFLGEYSLFGFVYILPSLRKGMHVTKSLRMECGLSIIELMMTLVVFSLLLTVSLPGLSEWIRDAKQSAQVNSFLSDLALARTESIRRSARVVLCVSSNGSNCSESGAWHQGRIVFVDENNDAQRDADEELLLVELSDLSRWILRGNAPVAEYVSYHPSGRAQMISGAFQAGTITICPISRSAVKASQIVISASGRPRIRRTLQAECL